MRDDRVKPRASIRRCRDVDPRRIGPVVRLAQHARRLLKATIWHGLTAALDRLGFITPGCRGGVMSNLMFYFWFSSRYVVLPLFHTHPGLRNDLGLRMPSPADYWLMSSLRTRLGGGPVGERVCFPDGSCTEYGVTGAGHYYFRRPGENAYLFPAL